MVEPIEWECGARQQGSAGGNTPPDCDWPVCGCDPYATEVIEVLQESGRITEQPVPSKAAQDVFEKRQRQVEAEGWTPKHDDEHDKGGALTVAARAACSRMGIMDPDGGRTLPDDLLRPATAPSDPECYLSKVEALISEYLGKPDISRETQSLLEDLFIDVEKLGNSLP